MAQHRGGDLLAELNQADLFRKHELHFTAADFLVECHGCQKFCSLRRAEFQLSWQARTVKKPVDPRDIVFWQAKNA